MKARIVAETFLPGAWVCDVATRYGIVARHLSTWRSLARKGLFALPAGQEPAFVPLTLEASEPMADDEPTIGADVRRKFVDSAHRDFRGSAACAIDLFGGTGGVTHGGAEGRAVIFPDQAVRIVMATRPVDFRKGHDGLAALAQAELGFVPHTGVMVVFRSKRGDRAKILFRDGSGIVLIYKRLEQGNFAWPKVSDGVMRLSRVQFEALFDGLDWRRIRASRPSLPAAAE